MEQVKLNELLQIHSYLTKLENPSNKMKEALTKIEEHLHLALTTLKQIRPAD